MRITRGSERTRLPAERPVLASVTVAAYLHNITAKDSSSVRSNSFSLAVRHKHIPVQIYRVPRNQIQKPQREVMVAAK